MNRNYSDISYAESPFGTLSEFMSKTFGWMFAGLLVTFLVGIGAVTTGLIYPLITSGLFILTSIAELVLVFVLSARVQTLQPSTATGIFFAYAVLNGLNLSSIFLVYDFGSLILAFLVGAVYFGVMAVYGNVTNRDLTGWGPKLMGGLVAKERLQIILAHERNGRSAAEPDYLPALQRELVAVISKYVKINPEDLKVQLERQDNLEVLEVKIELPDTVR